VENADYQDRLKNLANRYHLIPDHVANFPHLEIAAIFLAHAASFFLKPGGKLAYVLPRAFIGADHHDNTRSGRAEGFTLTEIWDLDRLIPLFNVPACVFFAEQSNKPSRQPPKKGIPGFKMSGRLTVRNLTLKEVINNLDIKPVTWYYSKLKTRSAFTTTKIKRTEKVNYYHAFFKQGATIVRDITESCGIEDL
jgi:hypothetical protein